MVYAIAECHQYDEVKDIRDKAAALETYARQARNTEAERKAADVRLRAERRAGELLKELARGEGAREPGTNRGATPSNGATPSPYAAALEATGTSRQTAARYQALAEIPQETFDAHLADPVRKPTTNAIIAKARDPQPKIDNNALWLWGRARDFERNGYVDADPITILESMTETMRADLRRILPSMIDFFQRMQKAI